MSLRRQVFKGAAILGSGQAASQLLSLVRNIIVARLLGPDDFGIAATFALTVSLLEMSSDLGTDKLLIQAADGDDPRLQATAHLWQFTRETLGAVVILALAWPLAALFGVPQARWAFCWLALVPLARGLLHLDVKRLQRNMRFFPQVSSELGAQLAATAVAWPLACWLRDYSAMLWIVIVQTGALVVCSHLQAERPYRWDFDRPMAARLFRFGWPLLVTGLLMFLVFQGDRALVAVLYSVQDLGLYAAALTLAAAPATFFGSLVSSVALPALSRAQAPLEFQRRYALALALLAVLAGVVLIVIVLTGSRVLVLAFGRSFAPAAPCLTLLAVAHSIRLLRVGTTTGAMARGDTGNSLWSNVWRVLGVGMALVCAALGAPLPWIAAAALLGEVVALVYSLGRLARRHGLGAGLCLRPALAAAPAVSGAVLAQGLGRLEGVLSTGLASAGFSALCAGLVVLAVPALRQELGRLLRRRPVLSAVAN